MNNEYKQPPVLDNAPEVHRYQVVKMLSEGGNKISYDPHGPWMVMADAHDAHITRLQTELSNLIEENRLLTEANAACGKQLIVDREEKSKLQAEIERLRGVVIQAREDADASDKRAAELEGLLRDVIDDAKSFLVSDAGWKKYGNQRDEIEATYDAALAEGKEHE